MIGVLYICTGRYITFWKDFYTSAEQFFLPNEVKTYFVFTDAPEIYGEDNPSVKKIYQKQLSWPASTLLRYTMYSAISSKLRSCTYIFSANANTVFVDAVGYHIYPGKEDNGLVATIHPALWKINAKYLPYERDPRSVAYIAKDQGLYYYSAAFSGGERTAYLQMIDELQQMINIDIYNGIETSSYDESHLNKYLLTRNPKALHSGYCYPEGWTIPFPPKLVLLNKLNYGGDPYLRELSLTNSTQK